MKKHRFYWSICVLLTVAMTNVYVQGQPVQGQPGQPAPPPPADTSASSGSGGVSKALTELDTRALPFLSRWTVCEAQVQKIVQQYFNTAGKQPGPDLAKIAIWGEPKKTGKYEIYMIKCGAATVVKKEIEESMQAIKDLLSQPIGEDGEEKYCHDFVTQSSVGGKVPSDIQQKVGIGENNYRMPTGGRQYFSLSAFEQLLRVGSTNWWIQNIIGNDQAGYQFWNAGEAKALIRRPLINNLNDATRRVVPNLLKFHLGYSYRLNDNVDNRSILGDLVPKRKLNIAPQGRLVGGMEAFIPLGEDMKTSVFGVNVNIELPISNISEERAIDASTFTKIPLPGKNSPTWTLNSHPVADANYLFDLQGQPRNDVTTPILRTTGQVSFFYSWWLEVEGSENPPDNIFRVDVGINYTEVQDVGLVQSRSTGLQYFAYSGVKLNGGGLMNYRPESLLDWAYAKFEYRNETTYPFGASLQFSNQILMGDLYFPLLGNWMYLELKYAKVLRDPRPYEGKGEYFMFSPVFRILIPR